MSFFHVKLKVFYLGDSYHAVKFTKKNPTKKAKHYLSMKGLGVREKFISIKTHGLLSFSDNQKVNQVSCLDGVEVVRIAYLPRFENHQG